ncbi:MAG: nucleoid occlusion protein [Syntrophomonadaceae bacterium]|nr:nucleoid occlusion protein [Syntrophomonadaceae bacterium]
MVIKSLERLLGRNAEVKVCSIDLYKIKPGPYQPRRQFSENDLQELAQSIEAYGVIQPIIVRQISDGYQIIAGERRYRACCLLQLETIPAIIRDMNDEKAAAVSLIENLQRRELSYLEEANAYSMLIHEFGLTQDELARRIGRSQPSVANKMRLLKLPEPVQSLISPDIITERHARALLKLNSTELQMTVLREVYERELTVKETEEMVACLCQHSIPREKQEKENGQNVSMIIRDARIFINTIKETVKRARQTGIDMTISEIDQEDQFELVIRIVKRQQENLRTARG